MLQQSPEVNRNSFLSADKLRGVQSPFSDKENNRSDINQSHCQQYKSYQDYQDQQNEAQEIAKIEEIVNDQNISLFDKLNHQKWQVRRMLYINLSEQFEKNQIVHEFQQAWLKNIINDQNQFAVFEGIKFIDVFVKSPQMNYHILPYFIGDLLERGTFQKPQCQKMVIDILFQCCKTQLETSFILQEIQRKIEAKHPKIMIFCLGFMNQLLDCNLKYHLSKEQIHGTFEYIIHLVQNTNKTIRQQAINIFTKLYSMVDESFEQIRKLYFNKELRQIQVKELEQVCKKIQKKQNPIKIEQKPQIQIQFQDMTQLLPDKFLELPYYKQNERKLKLEQFALNLERYNGEVDTNKDYSQIYNILISILEDNNYLIYSLGMRCIRGITKLLKKKMSAPVSRHFFLLILDKLKGSLSRALQSQVFNTLEDMLMFESISCELFMDLMISQLESNKNLVQRIACLRWFKDGWLSLAYAIQTKTYDQTEQNYLREFIENNQEKIQKSLVILYKKVVSINKKENNINLKKSCIDLLNQLDVDEENQNIRVLQNQIQAELVPTQESRINESKVQESKLNESKLHDSIQPSFAPLKLIKQKKQQAVLKSQSQIYNSQQQRYQTEEDLCELAQLQEEINTRKIDVNQLKQLIGNKKIQIRQSSVDQLTEAYNEFVNNSVRKSKSKSIGSGSRFSPYETPNKTKSRLEFTSSDEKEIHEQFHAIEESLLHQFTEINLEKLINYLNRYRAHQLSNKSQQQAIFLSPNSRSPGKHWRRGIGRENMIINTPGRHNFTDDRKFEDFHRVLEIIGQNYSEQIESQTFQIYYTLKHIFPQNIGDLLGCAFLYISSQLHRNIESYQSFIQNLLIMDKSMICFQYRQIFNLIYQQNDQESRLINLIQNAFFTIYYNILETNLLPYLPYYVTTITFMLQTRQFYEFSIGIFKQALDMNIDLNKIVENELIRFKKLYDTYLEWIKQDQEPPTPNLASFGQQAIQQQQRQKQCVSEHINNSQNNQILIMDLQNMEECCTKREDTLREEKQIQIDNMDQIHFKKEDFELLESTTRHFQNSQNTLRFTEECSQSHPEQVTTDLLNLNEYISPLQHCSQISQQDQVIQEISKNLYKYEKDKQAHQLQELNHIKQLNESYRQHRRDSSKYKEDQKTLQSQDLTIKFKQQQQYAQTEEQFYNNNQQQTEQSQEQFSKTQQSFQQTKNKEIFKQIKLEQEINQMNRSLLSEILAPIESQSLFDATRSSKRNECIKHMQEVLLTSTSLYFDVANTLLQQYEGLDILEDKISFINDLKLSLINETLLTNINEQNYAVIIYIVLRLCTSQTTQQEIYNTALGYDENKLTQELQLVLDVLLHSKSNEQVIISLIRVFNDHLPLDFTMDISRNEKMMLRLNLKCLERLVESSNQINVFAILIEILKFFKFHPPENLIEGLPQIKELELYFRTVKQITDQLIKMNKQQAKEFLEFIYRTNNKSIFMEYLKNALKD